MGFVVRDVVAGGSLILPIAVFTQIATACAPPQTWDLLRGIAAKESGFNPNAIHVNVNGHPGNSYYPATVAAAIKKARQLIAGGANIDAGLMGINRANWRRLGLTAETVFDPCQNVRAAADVLTLVSEYNTGSPMRGFRNGYVQRVVRASMRMQPRRPSSLVVASEPKTEAPSWNIFPNQ
jgi:type IV secretion system protein VirB1